MIFTKFFLPLVANFLSVILRYKSSSRSHQKRHSNRNAAHIQLFIKKNFFLKYPKFPTKISKNLQTRFYLVQGSLQTQNLLPLKIWGQVFFQGKGTFVPRDQLQAPKKQGSRIGRAKRLPPLESSDICLSDEPKTSDLPCLQRPQWPISQNRIVQKSRFSMNELEAENFRIAYWRPDEHLNFFFFQQFFLDFEILGPKVDEL